MAKFKIKSISIILAIMVAVSMVATPSVVNAKETKASLNKKIDNAQDKIDKNNKKKENISDEIDDIEATINESEKALNKLQGEVDEAKHKLVEQQEELAESNEGLNKRLRNIYKGGSVGFVDIIFSSGNISDLFSNIEMVKYIFENDKEVVQKLKKDKKETEKLYDSLASKEKALDNKREALQGDKALLAAQNKKLSKANAALEDDIEQWKADSAAIEAQIKNTISSGGGYEGNKGSGSSSAGYMWPVPSSRNVTSNYGWRICPFHGQEHHSGIDIAAGHGQAVVAANDGKVISAGWQGSYGNCIIIDHGNGITTLYAHNSSFTVGTGQIVKKGQTIARIGSTGNSTGPHCHFEVRINGSHVSPWGYV